jgi:catechol 2,3-dioxygenase-like lactoylglutathione lyase family enzyme
LDLKQSNWSPRQQRLEFNESKPFVFYGLWEETAMAMNATEGQASSTGLDPIHHVAISVKDIRQTVDWYTSHFRCRVTYQDETWAMLDFANVKLALVIPSQHPPHLAFVSPEAEQFGELKPHRDGTRSIYVADPAGNPVEILAPLE